MKVTVENSKVNEFMEELEICFNCQPDELITWSREDDFRTTFILDAQTEEEEAHIELIIEQIESK